VYGVTPAVFESGSSRYRAITVDMDPFRSSLSRTADAAEYV
jgi:hypothetical protein